ncbi:hypothetical protein C8J57DRAFT_1232689 [Mycena rebaudengoi]|nr:hypothetical protein C8J57DRAFT_1232689 [Mycena rebaudengoi]
MLALFFEAMGLSIIFAAALTFVMVIWRRSILPSATTSMETEPNGLQRNPRPHLFDVLSEVRVNKHHTDTTWSNVMPFSATMFTPVITDSENKLGIAIVMPASQSSNVGEYVIGMHKAVVKECSETV